VAPERAQEIIVGGGEAIALIADVLKEDQLKSCREKVRE